MDPAPKLGRERIECLDVIRGVAVCGLVPINILDFAPVEDLFLSPSGLVGFEFWLWQFVQLFGSGKFMSLFAMLFGAGLILATEKADALGEPVTERLLKRLGWLWVFGMLHAYLIWHGDILVAYSVTGFVLFWCRKWKAKFQVAAGIAMLAVFSALIGLISLVVWSVDFDLGDWSDFEQEYNADFEKDLEAFRGNWLEQMPTRAFLALIIQVGGIPFLVFWIAGGMMFLGMALMKSGFFRGEWPGSRYRRFAVTGVAGGIVLSGLGATLTLQDFGKIERMLLHFHWTYWGTFVLAIGYAACLVLWCRHRDSGTAWLRRSFAAAGRMAFSNYLGQSVILGLIFYGHGLGLKGHLGFSHFMMVVPVVWAFQLTISVLWLRSFRFGPMEWLWRCLTYGKRIPIRARTE